MEVQLRRLFGNGQPGTIADHEDRLHGLETTLLQFKAIFRTTRWWLVAICSILPFIFGSGRFSLEKLLQHLGL